MKRTESYNRNIKVIPYCPNRNYTYPNQKQKRYYLDKFMDGAMVVVTSAGVIAALMFLSML